MTSPAAFVGLIYDGEDLQRADLGIFLEIEVGLNETPSVRGVDTIIPDTAGRTEQNRINDILTIRLVGIVCADEDQEGLGRVLAGTSYRTNMLDVRGLFATNRDVAELTATLEDGTIARISARPAMPMVVNEHPGNHAHVAITLDGYDDWTFEAPGS